MARKAVVDRDLILTWLREGKTTQHIAEQFGVSRQAVDLHRRDFISRGLLPDQRAVREKRAPKETVPPKRSTISLNEQIDLTIEAFGALKRLPELEAELEKYKHDYENALKEIERLREAEQKRQEQEQRFGKFMTP